MSPRYSIIIPAYNEEYELPRTLAAFRVAGQRYRARGGTGELEFIVVDNASTDRTAQIAREWGAHVVVETRRQIARVRNTGARAATGEILVTCDADSQPHPDIFLALDRRFTRKVLAAGVRIDMVGLPWYFRPGFFCVNLVSFFGRLPAGMFVVRRKDFLALGGFNEALYALEDVDFSRRLKALARRRHLRIRILWRYPIQTSSRKFRALSPLVIIQMLIQYMLHPRTTVRHAPFWDTFYYGDHLRESAEKSRP